MYFWLHPKTGKRLTGDHRLELFKETTIDTLGRAVTIQELRRAVGTLLANDSSLAEGVLEHGLILIDHTWRTNEEYYKRRPILDEWSQANIVNPFFEKLS